MDCDTVIESLMYRCEERGEGYGEFVDEYCSREDLELATKSKGDEAVVARALLGLYDAFKRFEAAWSPIAAELERRQSFHEGNTVPPACSPRKHEWTANYDCEFGYTGSRVYCAICHTNAGTSTRVTK